MANYSVASPLQTKTQTNRTVLSGLMAPSVMMVLNMSMFGVALPAIRSSFNASADVIAWLVTAYSLAFAILMPLYGRLGDGLGKKRLYLAGINIFLVGTIITLFAPNMLFLMIGRVVQGLGVAGLIPLGMAIIMHRFPAAEQGKMLGTWNSVGPATGIVAPILGGFLIDNLTWRAIFWPVLIVGVIAIVLVRVWIPGTRQEAKPGFLRAFDWGGVVLLGGAMIAFIFYVSSRPITGVPALEDWRLLSLSLILLTAFIYWERRQERRQQDPFVKFAVFRHGNFAVASIGASMRMFLMSSVGLLIPLYLADVYQLNAASTGVVLTLHAAALLLTTRFGGQLADKWGSSRLPVMIGSGIQGTMMIYLALLPVGLPVSFAVGGAILHGLGAGMALAALHRAAMDGVPAEESGAAAGLYSMIRFGGLMLGTALCGVVLQFGFDKGFEITQAYQMVFWMVGSVAILGVLIGSRLK